MREMCREISRRFLWVDHALILPRLLRVSSSRVRSVPGNMSTFQVSAISSSDDINGSFRTSLRASRGPVRERKPSKNGSQRSDELPPIHNSHSLNDSGIASMENISSRRSTSSLGQRAPRTRRRSQSTGQRSQRRPRSQMGNRLPSMDPDYDASIHNQTPFISRFNQRGEVYAPVSYAWDAFKERLFDSSLSEKYEMLTVKETTRDAGRFRSVTPSNFDDDDEEEEDDTKNLLFLQDPLARSMYKNMEQYFDRKNSVRALSDGLSNSFSARGGRRSSQLYTSNEFSSTPPRPQSSMGFIPGTARSLTSARLRENGDMPRPQSSMELSRSSYAPTSLLSRRKREQSVKPKPEQGLEDVKREIEERFAKINFEEGTTDYDALFTVSEEMTEKLDEMSHQNGEVRPNERAGDDLDPNGVTPKFKLDHLRF